MKPIRNRPGAILGAFVAFAVFFSCTLAAETNSSQDDKSRADALVEQARESLKKAPSAGSRIAKEKELKAAAEALSKAFRICPTWPASSKPKDPWQITKDAGYRANLLTKAGESRKAVKELEEALGLIPRDKLDAKSYLMMLVGDSYFAAKDWAEAEKWYLNAEKTGLYGDREVLVPQKLEATREKLGRKSRP